MMPSNQKSIDWITRTISVLGMMSVLTVCVLAYLGKQIPPELNTLAGGLVGSLASMLVKTTATDDKNKTQDVKVVNDPEKKDETIPVKEQPSKGKTK